MIEQVLRYQEVSSEIFLFHCLIDTDRHIRNAYGLTSGEWVLIRPDGYIAAFAVGEKLRQLEPLAQLALPPQR
jgi:hypothetical protein